MYYMTFFEDIKQRFRLIKNYKRKKEFTNELDKINVASLNTIAYLGFIFEVLGIILLLSGLVKSANSYTSLIQLSFCAMVCALTAAFTGYIMSKKKRNHKLIVLGSVAIFTLLSLWGMEVSFLHFMAGDQIITFYTIEMVLVCFVVMTPFISVPIVMSSFAAFYCIMYIFNGAAGIQVFNYLTFGAICAAASVSRYFITAEQITRKLEIKKMNKELESLIGYDYMTQTKNRYFLNKDVKKFLGKPLSVIMCDVDNFKQFNDRYGHQTGDKVIIEISKIFCKEFSVSEIYRYGGDEFLIVLRNEAPDNTEQRLAKIKNTISQITITKVKEKISCSFGFAFGEAHNENEFEKLINLADKKLYDEKSNKKS